MATLEITPSGQACGATVRGVDVRDLDDAMVAALREAWLEHKVLSFPHQSLTDADLEQFTLRFGPFGTDPYFASIEGHSNIAAIRRRADESSSLFGESWHTDWSFQERPPDGTCLLARVIPPAGGDTLYADQEMAFARMDPALQERLRGVQAVHSARNGYAPDGLHGDRDEGRSMDLLASADAYATQTHPLVRVHPETGRETLFSTIGYIIGIEGMDDAEAYRLLVDVHREQTAEAVQYRHVWEPGMLVLWDNRCLLHRATGGYEGHDRLLHRTTVGWNPLVGNRSS